MLLPFHIHQPEEIHSAALPLDTFFSTFRIGALRVFHYHGDKVHTGVLLLRQLLRECAADNKPDLAGPDPASNWLWHSRVAPTRADVRAHSHIHQSGHQEKETVYIID